MMLDSLDDHAPPRFGDEFRDGVDRLVDAKRRRTRTVAGGVGILAIGAGAVLLTQLPGDGSAGVVDTPSIPTPAPDTTVEVVVTLPPTSSIVAAAPEPELLGGRDETLATDEWLMPTVLPDGFGHRDGSIQYELVRDEFGAPIGDGSIEITNRSIGFVRADASGSGGRIDIEIWDAPSSRPPIVNADPGWIVDGFQASRSVGSSQVSVSSSPGAMNEAEFRAVVDSLAITSRAAFDGTVLDQFGPDAIELASVEFEGSQFDAIVQHRDDGLDCFFFGPFPATGYSCADPTGFEGAMHWESMTGLRPGTSTQEIQAFGTVRDDVASVEVELMDGSVQIIEPTAAVDDYPHRVWILATSVEVDTTVNPLTLGPAVRAVTAFDADGVALAEDRRCC